ncbi:GIY-YIG nuclease family protein [Bradyrhizobium japonicum]|nr:GIY-YIG nuclease family protein [Bradyrhizobium japonicum]
MAEQGTIGRIGRLVPRGLNIERAAEHLGLSIEEFNLFLLLGRIPQPVAECGQMVWPVETLFCRKRPTVGYRVYAGVYVVGFLSFIKIGKSLDVTARLGGIYQSLPLMIKVHHIFEGKGRPLERQLHERFSKNRTRGEWFKNEGEVAAWVEGGCK